MKLINDNIIETIFSKIPGVVFSTDGLNGGIDIFRFCIFIAAVETAVSPGRLNSSKCFFRLLEDFFTMGDKEDPPIFG